MAKVAAVIVSYRHNFIFLKARKTAGTTLELLLSGYLGPDDVLAPGGPSGEFMRLSNGGLPPQNFATDPDVEARYLEALHARRKGALQRLSHENLVTGGCTAHMSAKGVRDWVGEEFFAQAFKFTAERHPYEKALSLAHFQYRPARAGDVDFPTFLDQTIHGGKYPGRSIYTIDGESVIDDRILYDTLGEDVRRIWAHLGLPEDAELPGVRRTERSDRAQAAEILTDAQKERIYARCRLEFELFGWER